MAVRATPTDNGWMRLSMEMSARPSGPSYWNTDDKNAPDKRKSAKIQFGESILSKMNLDAKRSSMASLESTLIVDTMKARIKRSSMVSLESTRTDDSESDEVFGAQVQKARSTIKIPSRKDKNHSVMVSIDERMSQMAFQNPQRSFSIPSAEFSSQPQHTTKQRAQSYDEDFSKPHPATRPRAQTNPYPVQSVNPRKAFVVGNSEYENCANIKGTDTDIQGVQEALQVNCGFNRKHKGFTWQKKNLDRATFMKQFRLFCSNIQHDDDILFYYCGHGIMCGGEMFLVPCDAPDPQRITPANVHTVCIRVNELKLQVSRRYDESKPPRLKIFCIDACASKLDYEATGWRNSQLATDEYDMHETRPRGLLRLEPNKNIKTIEDLNSSPLGKNWYIITAAAPGTTALETGIGGGRFTNAWLNAIESPQTTIGFLCPTIVTEVTQLTRRGTIAIQIPNLQCNTVDLELSMKWAFNIC